MSTMNQKKGVHDEKDRSKYRKESNEENDRYDDGQHDDHEPGTHGMRSDCGGDSCAVCCRNCG
jgi:hypothetical protein